MIICTRCGTENLDDAPFCIHCNRKLQSLRRAGVEAGPTRRSQRLRPMQPSAGGTEFRTLLARCAEVWTVAALVAGLSFWGLPAEPGQTSWWIGVGALALGAAWLRWRG
ncbi:zinc-ribbon domain-containing protein [Paucidesulfovibrio gracilis DSM 16080]|uniref:Zinc-ribbon domain-containing protein n=1 Tax=Paucidesulfovibrio gracilis DSM 16080 TaxID=1121449 RepID=A0A1T4W8K6_9BACT|nr:zinc ribbon domain-containing protein [Paucidesulfovibrio gracilis]SKA73335.1 zinc-ribbon domain-containing protein [Paucidesulfovibrio gracilis DSM 16080]